MAETTVGIDFEDLKGLVSLLERLKELSAQPFGAMNAVPGAPSAMPGGAPSPGIAPSLPPVATAAGVVTGPSAPAAPAPLPPAVANQGGGPPAIRTPDGAVKWDPRANTFVPATVAPSPGIAPAMPAGTPAALFPAANAGTDYRDPIGPRQFAVPNGAIPLPLYGSSYGPAWDMPGPGRPLPAAVPIDAFRPLPPSMPPTPDGGSAAMFAALGQAGLYTAALSDVGNQAGAYAQGRISGTPRTSDQIALDLLPLMMAGGAAVGAVAGGGIGAVPGAIVGAGVGMAVKAGLAPGIDRAAQEMFLKRALANSGRIGADEELTGMYVPAMNAMEEGRSSGRYLGKAFYESLDRMYNRPGKEDPYSLQSDLPRINRAALGAGYVTRYGLPTDSFGVGDAARALRYGGTEDLLGDAASLDSLARRPGMGIGDTVAAQMGAYTKREDYVALAKLRIEGADAGVRVGMAGAGVNEASRFSGFEDLAKALAENTAATKASAEIKRREADIAERNGDRERAIALRGEASLMERQTAIAQRGVAASAEYDQNSAATGLMAGRADRAFGASSFSGAANASLPYAGRTAAVLKRVADIDARLRAGDLSPSERLNLQDAREAAQYQADYLIPKEREERGNAQTFAVAERDIARDTNATIDPTLRGDVYAQSTGGQDAQLNALSQRKAAIEAILATSKMLTFEQRTQYETQLLQIEGDRKRVQVQRDVGAAMAGVQTAGLLGSRETSVYAREIATGAGGLDAQAATFGTAAVAGRNALAANKAADDLVAKGFSPNSREVLSLRAQAEGATTQEAVTRARAAVAPMGTETEIGLSDVRTRRAIMEQGYGSFGEMRENLLEEASFLKDRLQEIDAGFARAKREGPVSARAAADYRIQRNQVVQELAGANERYSSGWSDRLVSEVYNAGGTGRIALTQFNRRESAILGGVENRAFGGTEEQTRRYRERSGIEAARLMGSNARENQAGRAVSGLSERRMDVKVQVELIGDGARKNLRVRAETQNSFRSARDESGNHFSERQPSG